MSRKTFRPDPQFTCLFEGETLICLFASAGMASRFSQAMPARYSTRIMTLRELAGVEEKIRIGSKLRAAMIMGSIGGMKGGAIRASRLTPERRREIAVTAARRRWDKAPNYQAQAQPPAAIPGRKESES